MSDTSNDEKTAHAGSSGNHYQIDFKTLLISVLPLLILSVIFSALYRSKSDSLETRCKLTLRSLGSMLYLDAANKEDLLNPDNYYPVHRVYSSWDGDVYETDMEDLIDYYDFAAFELEDFGDEIGVTFTIVAIPRKSIYTLRTYAINEDQKIRIWHGNDRDFDVENIDLHNPDQWQALR